MAIFNCHVSSPEGNKFSWPDIVPVKNPNRDYHWWRSPSAETLPGLQKANAASGAFHSPCQYEDMRVNGMNIPLWLLPSGYVKIAIENGPVEIVSFPINSMVIFHSYVTVYERVNLHYPMVFLYFSHDFPIFLWFSYGFPMVFHFASRRFLSRWAEHPQPNSPLLFFSRARAHSIRCSASVSYPDAVCDTLENIYCMMDRY